MRRLGQAAAVFAVLLMSAGLLQKNPALAQSKCEGAKLKAAAKKASCIIALRAKEAATGKPADATKLAACSTKFSAVYGKLDTKDANDCGATVGDANAVEDTVDLFVTGVLGQVTTPCPAGCVATGSACSGNSDCCSGTCFNGPIICGCSVVGACCAGPNSCCGGQACIGGRCSCLPTGASCGGNTDCCSGSCSLPPPGNCQ